MTTGHHPHTATILPFPGRARASGKDEGHGARSTGSAGGAGKTQRIARPDFTDSWYHQAAIDEASHGRKP
ncbi:DUF2735 domain-containing protein [Methylobacterium sp. J-068]|uniref:DUF2735 domain-containing protein n=1 Tax=Methylobacterium sp. J-068 TaxID=2836649 RepID=UPI001FBA8050|nr:DUF2735 domain-containing protein [Methylobacterium sp. J-068]MCJ2035914.1 DUF2735 domain-containing protein [Methylobacterium sp. J-068]